MVARLYWFLHPLHPNQKEDENVVRMDPSDVEYGPAHERLVLIPYAQIPLINANADTSSTARCLIFGPLGVFVIWGECLFIFRELGSTGNFLGIWGASSYFWGI